MAPEAPLEALPSDRRILVNAFPDGDVRKGDTCAVRVAGVGVVLQPSVTTVPRSV